MRTTRLIRSNRGVSAVGFAAAIAIGVGATGAILTTMMENKRKGNATDAAKTIAEQINKTTLESTMQLIQSKTLQKQTIGGTPTWVKSTNATSPTWTFTPAAGVNPATLSFSFCDPRYADPSNPTDLTLCANDRVNATVQLIASSGAGNEVRVVASAPLTRRSSKVETSSSRAVLDYTLVTCSGAPTVSPSTSLLSGETFTLSMSTANFSPSNATVTLVNNGQTFTGTNPKVGSVVAPTVASGSINQSYVVRITAPNGNSVDCPAANVTVSACVNYASDAPVREVFKSLTYNLDSDISANTRNVYATEFANGTSTQESLWQSIFNGSDYGIRSGATASGDSNQRVLAFNVIAMMRDHYGRGGTNPQVQTHSNYVRQMTVSPYNLYPQCLYSNTVSPCSAFTTIGNFPKLATNLRTAAEFTSAPNSSQYHPEFLDEAYRRYWGIEVAQMTAAEQTQRTNFLTQLRAGTLQFGPASVAGTVLNQIQSNARYNTRGQANGELVNGMVRTLYGRNATDGETSYYGALVNGYGWNWSKVSQRFRSQNEFRNVGGCVVPPPSASCTIAGPTQGSPGQTIALTMRGADYLTSASWDGANLAVAGVGGEQFVKNITLGGPGTTTTSTATVTNAGGSSTCSISVLAKQSARTWQARRGAQHCSGGVVQPYYNQLLTLRYEYYRIWTPDLDPYVFAHRNTAGWDQWDSQDAELWYPQLRTSNMINCFTGFATLPGGDPDYFYRCIPGPAAPASPPWPTPNHVSSYCNDLNVMMPAVWTNPADGLSYQLMTNPSTGQPANILQGGLCGSPDVPCMLRTVMSPLFVDLRNENIEYKPGVWFDLAEGLLPYFWPKADSGGAFIALDRNSNGKIDNGAELFGNVTPDEKGRKSYGNGFHALAAHDANKDGFIDDKDPVFEKLVLWNDANMNGTSEPRELLSLAAKEVKSIDLKYLDIQEQNDFYGNKSNQRSLVELKDGSWRRVYDLWFVPSGDRSQDRTVASSGK